MKETPQLICPRCKDVHDALTGVDHQDEASPGDFAVCINCGAINQMSETMKLKVAAPRDLYQLWKEDIINYTLMDSAAKEIKKRGRIR